MSHQERLFPRLDVFGDPIPEAALSRCGTHRLWHPPEKDGIPFGLKAVSFSPDSRRVVSASGSTARVWDLEDGREVLVLSGHRDAVCAVHYVSHTRIVTGSADGTIRLWDAEQGAELRQWSPPGGAISCMALSSNGRTILAGTRASSGSPSSNGFAVLDLAADEPLRWVCPEGAVGNTEFLAFSPDGSRAAVVERTFDLSRLCVFDTAAWSLLWSARDGGEYTPAWAAFSDHGRSVIRDVAGEGWRTLRRTFDTDTGVLLAEAETSFNPPLPLPDGTSIQVSSRKLEFLRDGEVFQEVDSRAHLRWDVDLVRSPDERWATFSKGSSTVVLIELATGRVLPARAHRDRVTRLTFSRDGTILVSSSADGSVRSWDCASGRQEACVDLGQDEDDRYLHLSQGRALVAGHWIRDALAGTEVELEDGCTPYQTVWSADGALISELHSWRGEQFARVHDTRTGKLLRKVPLSLENDDALALSGSGRFLVTGVLFEGRKHWQGSRIWDLESGTSCLIEHGMRSDFTKFAFSPDDAWLAFEDGLQTLALVDPLRPERRLRWELPARLSAFAFSEDGRILATGDHEGRVRVWRVGGELLGVVEGHRALVTALAFSADGSLLASGSADTTVLLWPERAWNPGGH
ncbi:WD40 repeat domain-containing protein [Vitiosangium sp. GDMCC 1.1324]|uniref:WD40 repeat domain-containing protein n=1 Tax=Vitiosangium sp. (strain GDMCC 1.1324) TaxID=2138576 RepID=UPI000D33442F|nr:hypothetical protein [Vitiosangium sp. GDMCC 1.1324]PTL78477.1 hypothetical protein DAT35_38760 [Vitiosangium sp. GDMCC 1.1324]